MSKDEKLEYIKDVLEHLLSGEDGFEEFIDDLGDTKEHLTTMLEVFKSEEIQEPIIDEDSVHGI